MKRIYFTLMICSASIISLMFNSCKKETPDTETQSSVDNSICEGEFNNFLSVINGYARNQQGLKGNRTVGPSVTVSDTTHFPVTMTIDYGTTGIIDTIDNKVRKGQIVASFSNKWHISGTTATVKLVNYFVANTSGGNFVQYNADSIMIKRTDSIVFTNAIINGTVVSPAGWSLKWASTRTMTQTGGYSTITFGDDVFSATGNSTGTDRNGKTYTVTLKNPIVKRSSCAWIESGSLDLTPDGLSVRTVDYGTGTCDNKVTLVINGNTFTFSLN